MKRVPLETLTFQPIFGPFVLAMVIIAALLMLLIGPSFTQLAFSRRVTLSLLRLGVIGLAILATLRPGCVQKIEKNQSAVLLFLIDSTRSMELPHLTDDSTRWGALVDTIRDNQSRFLKLAENKIDVRFFSFDNRTYRLEVEDGTVKLPEKPEGSETDIGTAVYDTSLDVRDQRLLGVFVASDGVQNVLEPEVELTQAADSLADMEIPLVAIQLGLPGDTGQLADVAITSFPEQLVVNKKNDLVAKATMISRGYANQDIGVELIVTDAQGNETRVATEVYRPSSSYEEANLELKYRPTEPGEYRIKVRAIPMLGELATRNNELDGFLTVRDEGMRVLFLNGSLGNEQQFLRMSLPALDFVEMDFRPIYTTAAARQTWPLREFESDFRDLKKYDVFVLCNVDSSVLYSENYPESLNALADAVINNGKGLLMLGGNHSFGAGRYDRTPLAKVLPIKMKATERQEFDADIRRDLHINSPFKIRPTRNHFLTRIAEDGSNKAAWGKLPGLVGANRIVVKDTAEVFLESDDDVNRPILAGANVGGRVLVFAGDSSWRWRRFGFGKEFDQFWRQVILWLAFWDSRNDESVSIELPKRRFSPKALVKFDVIVKTIGGEAVENVNFDAFLELPSGDRQPISVSQVGDRYESQLDPESLALSGLYKVQVAAQRDGEMIGQSEREFVVMDRDKEKSNPVANPEQMKRLANQTSQFGGRAIVPEQLSEILDQYIENPPMTKIEIPLKWRLGDDFWNALWFLLAFVGLLSTEWLLRKKWGLV